MLSNNQPVAICKASLALQKGERNWRSPTHKPAHTATGLLFVSFYNPPYLFQCHNPCSQNQIMEETRPCLVIFFPLLLQSCWKLVLVTIVYNSASGRDCLCQILFYLHLCLMVAEVEWQPEIWIDQMCNFLQTFWVTSDVTKCRWQNWQYLVIIWFITTVIT